MTQAPRALIVSGILFLAAVHPAFLESVDAKMTVKMAKSSKIKKSAPADTEPAIKPVPVDTVTTETTPALPDTIVKPPSDTSAPTDTNTVDTLPFSARFGGRFFHKKIFSHAPQEGERNVVLAEDTAFLQDTFAVCPICFEAPITEEDFELEEAIANQVSGIVEFRYRRLDDEKVAVRLNRLGQPMTKILDRKHLEFYFTPLRSSLEKNALSAGNGYIYFTTGLLNILEDDEEIAAVLAHEICHAEFRHVLQDFKLSQKLTLITAIASAVVNRAGNIGGIFQVLQDYAASLVMNGFSRQFELEADAGGKWLLETSGHDTHAMRRVLMKLDDMTKDRGERSSLFLTHPEESERIKAFDQTRIFNRTILGDTISMRLKLQRPRLVGWFKERAVPALYASLINETDTPVYLTGLHAEYHATDMPDVKVEVSPGNIIIPGKSYGQIKILVIAKNELVRNPKALDFTCEIRKFADDPQPKEKKDKTQKSGTKPKERISFHFDLEK